MLTLHEHYIGSNTVSTSINSTKKKKSKQEKDNGLIELVVPPPCLVVGKSRSQTGSRRVTPMIPDSTKDALNCTVEKSLHNGDIYIGTLLGNVPHGTGKYLWFDGCMFEGEWKKGKAWGEGKFSWPSGATYEGEFKFGCMDGYGTFIGVEGDMYRGLWMADRKHGYGEKRYANGDVYEGSWRYNLQDGEGRYVWKNGNEYVGEWKSGAMSGKGVLLWANGNRYEWYWENGTPKSKGVFTWANGTKSSGNRDMEFKNEDMNFQMATRKRSSVEGRNNVSFPRICIWELDEEAGDISCDIVDNVEASMFYRDGCESTSGGGAGEVAGQVQMNPWSSVDVEFKKPGQVISKGHKSYDLAHNLQLGIRYSVGKHASIFRDLRPSDFDLKEKFWTRFPPEGSKCTPPHQSVDFRWKDYCPTVFRELFAIDPADYMIAICGNGTLREMSSPGKSGSFFYLTQDNRFIIKTVKKSEVKVLIRMLPSYYQHVCQHKNSLVTKFLGVHCVKPVGGQKTRFIVMGNLFSSEYHIHRRFDLKGSSYGRITAKFNDRIDETTTLKDLDLNFVFHLEQSWFQELMWQIDRDCEFLEAEGIMDYSLLIGLHCRGDVSNDEAKASASQLELRSGNRNTHCDEILMQDRN